MPSLSRRASATALLAAALLAAPAALAYKRFCATDDSLQFGNRALGSSTTATVTISSCGDEAWTFTTVSLHAATAPAFHVQSGCATGMTLEPGDRCDVNVTFAPAASGQTSGALWLRQTSTTADQLLTFYGRGTDSGVAGTGAIAFSPAVEDFGDVAVGTTSGWRTVALTNTGTASVIPSALVINGRDPYDFATVSHGAASDCAVGRAITPGRSCTLNFTFTPAAAGMRSAQLVVDAPQLTSLVTLPIVGNGADADAGTVAAVEFFNASRHHYFVTTEPAEAAMIDAGGVGPGWVRTGMGFRVWPAIGDAGPERADVCRFFGAERGPAAHFFTGHVAECAALRNDPVWHFEGVAFRAPLPVLGECRAGFEPVVRLFWNGALASDMRHRYLTDAALVSALAARGWIVEGPVFCSPRRTVPAR